MLPVQQVGEGQQWPGEMVVEPATEIVQRNGCRQAGPQPRQGMRPLLRQAKGRQQLVMPHFDDLAPPGELAPHSARPGLRKGLAAFWRTEQVRCVVLLPVRPPAFAFEVGIRQRVATSQRVPDRGHARLGTGAARLVSKVSAKR